MCRTKKIKLISVFVVLALFGCGIQQASVSLPIANNKVLIPIEAGKTFIVNETYDLNGGEFEMPRNVTLVSGRGVIKNGTLIGNETKVKGAKAVFDHVSIQGSWNVPEISTSLFKDLTRDNSLKDVFALSSSDVYNRIQIEDGDYYVSTTSYGVALYVQSNTEINLLGRIHLRPNDYRGYTVLGINNNNNIIIKGKGLIEGDRQTHTGRTGEWGHGISILEGKNIHISGISVSNCWGDCIYVGNDSKNVTIEECVLSKGRRQGISITSGEHIVVKDSRISEIAGTSPQYAIDVEPNENEVVDDVLLENIYAINCFGGYKSWGGAKGATIGTIVIRGCFLINPSSNYPIRFDVGKKVIVEKCDFETKMNPGIVIDNIDDVVVEGNVVRSGNSRTIAVYREKIKKVSNNTIVK